jgi:uncharacterized protein (TIGR03790 family)
VNNRFSTLRLIRELARVAALLTLGVVAKPSVVLGQSPENVAVVINDNSADSQRIGDHYARMRGLSASNVLRIKTSTEEAVERPTYVTTIEQPLETAIKRAGLQDRLLYLVLTKGIPLRINGTSGLDGTLASVDSELTLLYRRLTGQPILALGKIDNPYFLGAREIGEARPFSHREHDIYLVTRIDAFTVDQAIALIDRSQSPVTEGQIVLALRGGASPGDQWLERSVNRLGAQGQQARVLRETTGAPVRTDQAVLGYSSSSPPELAPATRGTGLKFAPGAIAANLASFDARTFHQPPESWRPSTSGDRRKWFEGSPSPLVGDLVADGVTGVSGQVGEAYLLGAVRPDILFPAYLAGFNLAEAYYLAMPTLSWQAVVVGDPLCAPFGRKALTREQLEDATDVATALPGLFSKRRLAVIRAVNRDLPDSAGPLFIRAEALIEAHDNAGARKTLEEALTVAPRAIGVMVALAQLEEQAGEHETAIARYRRAVELAPGNVVALNNLAFALAVRRNAPAEGLPHARRAAALAPRSGNVLDTLGWIEHLLGNDSTAIGYLRQAAQLEPTVADIHVHAALVYSALGNAADSAAELKEALRLDPALESREEVLRLLRR